jgi:hypothetical protein
MRHEKLSPGLLLAYEDYQREGQEALIPHKKSLGIVAPKLHSNQPVVSFLSTVTNKQI